MQREPEETHMEETNNPDVETIETEVVETEETGQTETESEEGTSEESFFDPNSVPEELKPAYKQMQSAFTKKTQGIAEARKSLENFESYRPLIEKLSDPRNAYLRNILEGNQPAQQEQSQPYPTDPMEYAKWVQDQTVERMAADQDRREASKVDPRLDTDKTFTNMILGIVSNNQEYSQGKISAVEATKQAVKAVDEMIVNAKKSGKAELSEQASNKAKKYASPKGTGAGTVNTKSPQSMQEAADMALEQINS